MNLLNSLLNDQSLLSNPSNTNLNPNDTNPNTSPTTTTFSQSSPNSNSSTNVSSSSQYMADKLMEKIITMIIPVQNEDEVTTKMINDRLEWQKTRPSLSFALMQKNSNMLHQRNSSTYELFNHVLKFINWQDPFYTIGILLIITHIILQPYLITILPLVSLVINTLIPHYLIIYPPDGYLENHHEVSSHPLFLSKIPKPVPLFSKEFFINLTDTQNFMCMQTNLFDFGVWLTTDYLYFKNEQISSIVLIGSLCLIVFNLFFAPWVIKFLYVNFWLLQLNLIVTVWLITILFHPYPREIILEWIYNEDTRMNCQNFVNKIEDKLTSVLEKDNELEKFSQNIDNIQYGNDDIKYVEIFELQKLDLKTKIWELIGFSNDFYTTNSVIRKYNEFKKEEDVKYIEGVELRLYVKDSISDIQPPIDYKFVKNSKWLVDFEINKWVTMNSIKDLVLIDDDEKWAYDFMDNGNNEYNNIKEENTNLEFYRRRRWVRKVIRENYKDKDFQTPHSHLAEWLG